MLQHASFQLYYKLCSHSSSLPLWRNVEWAECILRSCLCGNQDDVGQAHGFFWQQERGQVPDETAGVQVVAVQVPESEGVINTNEFTTDPSRNLKRTFFNHFMDLWRKE